MLTVPGGTAGTSETAAEAPVKYPRDHDEAICTLQSLRMKTDLDSGALKTVRRVPHQCLQPESSKDGGAERALRSLAGSVPRSSVRVRAVWLNDGAGGEATTAPYRAWEAESQV